ncbi:MAG: NAD(P)H-hydrate dehydratase [Lentisphaeria bacterium]
MYSLSPVNIKHLESLAFQQAGIPASELMEKAGAAVCQAALRLAASAALDHFVILAGKGNNAGDAFVCARLLLAKGCRVSLFLTSSPEKLQGEARTAFSHLRETLQQPFSQALTPDAFLEKTLIIDGLLGTGVKGTPKEPIATWIKMANASGCPILAIDLPSGLNADDGSTDLAIIADYTVTFAVPKTGMLLQKGPECCGRLEIADIGIPENLLRDIPGDLEVFSGFEARQVLRRENFTTYKNQRGHLGVIGGSSAYGQAPFLTAEAALRCGSGLCTVLYPKQAECWGTVPKAIIVRRIEDAGKGYFNRFSLQEVSEQMKAFTVLACGPGMSCHADLLPVLELLLSTGKPMVLDADALNLLSLAPELLKTPHAELLLTPHPGEMSRLLKAFRISPDLSRQEQTMALANATKSTVVLKGCRSITASCNGDCTMNLSGCAALATAGSGDVLAGVCASFLGQQMSPFTAAALAVYVHGLTGEILRPLGSRGILADDLLAALPDALQQISPIT